jgi:hypothetical protein
MGKAHVDGTNGVVGGGDGGCVGLGSPTVTVGLTGGGLPHMGSPTDLVIYAYTSKGNGGIFPPTWRLLIELHRSQMLCS